MKTNFKANPKASASNVAYILRDSAAEHYKTINLPLTEKNDLIAFAATREFEEDLKRHRSGSIPRNHHRIVLSFESESSPERVLEIAEGFIKKSFPDSVSIIACHTDTKNLHCHVWLDAVQLDGRKIHVSKNIYKKLDETWARTCDKIYGTNRENEYREKKFDRHREHQQQKDDWKLTKHYEQSRVTSGKFNLENTSAAIERENSISRSKPERIRTISIAENESAESRSRANFN
jgi:hypothetical protein